MFDGTGVIRPRFGGVALAACLAVTMPGCGGGDEGPTRYDISGTVTFDGQPIPDGMIVFEHDETKISSACPIVDGYYESESDKGHLGGKYTVFVSGYASKPQGALPGPELFQGRWTTKVELPAESTTKDFDIPKSEVKAAPAGAANPADQT